MGFDGKSYSNLCSIPWVLIALDNFRFVLLEKRASDLATRFEHRGFILGLKFREIILLYDPMRNFIPTKWALSLHEVTHALTNYSIDHKDGCVVKSNRSAPTPEFWTLLLDLFYHCCHKIYTIILSPNATLYCTK